MKLRSCCDEFRGVLLHSVAAIVYTKLPCWCNEFEFLFMLQMIMKLSLEEEALLVCGQPCTMAFLCVSSLQFITSPFSINSPLLWDYNTLIASEFAFFTTSMSTYFHVLCMWKNKSLYRNTTGTFLHQGSYLFGRFTDLWWERKLRHHNSSLLWRHSSQTNS